MIGGVGMIIIIKSQRILVAHLHLFFPLLPVPVFPFLVTDLVENHESVIADEWKRYKRSIISKTLARRVQSHIHGWYKLVDQVTAGFESTFILIVLNKMVIICITISRDWEFSLKEDSKLCMSSWLKLL